MTIHIFAVLTLVLNVLITPAYASPSKGTTSNLMDELDPFAPNIDQTLKAYDKVYQRETGQSAFIGRQVFDFLNLDSGCVRDPFDIKVISL